MSHEKEDEYNKPQVEINIKVNQGTYYLIQGSSGNPSGSYQLSPSFNKEGIIVRDDEREKSSAALDRNDF